MEKYDTISMIKRWIIKNYLPKMMGIIRSYPLSQIVDKTFNYSNTLRNEGGYMLESLLTHQKEFYCKLLEHIETHPLLYITGKSGIGKSYIARTLYKDKFYDGYTVLLFTGDIENQYRPYFPFSRLFNNTSTLQMISSVPVELSKDIPKLGNSISFFINSILNRNSIKYKNDYPHLNSEELAIISKLKYLSKKKKLFLIFDNFQWWDQQSITLIKLILNSPYDFNFTTKNHCVFIFTYPNASDKNLEDFFAENKVSKLIFNELTYEQFLKDKKYLGYDNALDEKRLHFIYKLGDGNLLLYKKIAKEIPSDEYIFCSQNPSGIHYLNTLLETRMIQLGATGKQIMYILEFGSVIGMSFSSYELEKVTHTNAGQFIKIINKAKEWELVEDDERTLYIKFVHEIILEIFKHRAEDNIYCYYEKLEKCLKEITPGNYMRRARYCVLMRELTRANILYLMELFQEIRNNNVVFEDLENEALVLMDDHIRAYYYLLKKAYLLYLEKKYIDAIDTLDRIPASYNPILLAERDLLKSRCLSKSIDKQERELAVTLLERYKENTQINEEVDLWERLMTSLITAYYHSGKKSKAKFLEEDVLSKLAIRSKFDIVAQLRMHILYRNSNAIHGSEFAEGLIEKSVVYFKGNNNLDIPYNILEYYKSLVNYSSSLCKNGKYVEAFLQTQNAIKLQRDFSDIDFPREQIIHNNFAVSGYLSKQLDLLESIKILESICENVPSIAEKIFYATNLTIFYLLNNEIAKAKVYLQSIITEFNVQDDLEGSYKYKIYLTYALIYYIENDLVKAKHSLKTAEIAINSLTDKSYIHKKFKLILNLFNSEERIVTPQLLDIALLEKVTTYQNSVWDFLGRTFPYSILSNWDI